MFYFFFVLFVLFVLFVVKKCFCEFIKIDRY